MMDNEADKPVSRRKILTAFGIAGISVASGSVMASAKHLHTAKKKR